MGTMLDRIVAMTEEFMRMRCHEPERANQAVELAARHLRERGHAPKVLENRGHRMLVCTQGEGPKTLVLNGHLDVVAGLEDQYTPRLRDGRLYGRGGYDMQAACAVMIHLFCELDPAALPVRVMLQLSSTEETAGELCTGYLVEQGYTGDFCICGEPTNLAVSMMSKGVLRLEARVEGRAAHSSRPWLGENALLKAVDLFRRVEALPFAKASNRYFEGASLNLSLLEGGVVMNQVPDLARMVVDIRFVPGSDPEEILEQIRTLDPGVRWEETARLPAVEAPEEDPCVGALLEAVRAVRGECVQTAQHGAADTAFFAQRGIPAVEFGPCGAGHHGPEEYVELASLEEFYRILQATVHNMGGA